MARIWQNRKVMRSIFRYLAIFAVLVILSILLVSFITGGDGDESPTQTEDTAFTLTDYVGSSAILRLTTAGRITNDENYRAIRVSISPSARTIEILRGYQLVPERTETYPNNQAAYEAFLYSMANARYADKDDEVTEDEQGVCPLGRRYIYELIDGGQTRLSSWSTSCGRQGSFKGDGDTIRQLFNLQIPDYKAITRGVKLQA